jgi:hypothetical protein
LCDGINFRSCLRHDLDEIFHRRFAVLPSKRTHLISIIVLLLMFPGCNETVTAPETTPYGKLSMYDGCKTFPAATSSIGASSHPSNVECIEYEYNGEGLLVLEHINSGFNCCPKKITADIVVSGSEIDIKEKEQEQGCFCQCLFDVKYELHELAPGEYKLDVKGPYVEETDEELRLNLSLTGPGSETFCVSRTHYPWSIRE